MTLPTDHPAPAASDGSLPLTPADRELVEAARRVLVRHYRPFWHTVGAALRGRDGRIWTGIHLGTTVGRLAVCAEAVALGRAILQGDGTVDTAVAVRHPKPEEELRDILVVPPCGACREMLLDHDPDAQVILPGQGCLSGQQSLPGQNGLSKLPIRALLPVPYRR